MENLELEAEASNGDIMNSNHHENDSFDDDNDEDDEYDYFIGSEATSSTRALLDNGSKSSKRKPPSKIQNLLSSYVIPDLLMKDNSAFDDHRKNGHDSSTEKDRAMMCGLFKWRPAWLQPLANVYAFSALTGLSYFFSGMAGKALFGQLVSVERQFNIDSTKSGLLNSAWHFGFACSVLFAGHFAKSINIPLAIGLAGIINGFLIMAPSFLELYSPYELPQLDSSTTAFSKNQNSDDRLSDSRFLCSAHSYIESSEFSSFNISINVNETNEALHNDSDGRDSSSNDQRSDFPYYVLLTSMFLQGLICSFRYGALPFVYVDNNVLDKTKTGAYLAISFILSEFTGPLGDLVNSVLSKIPVDLSDTAMSTEDTRFVSAWWLSLLVFGILSAISASFVTLLPRHLVPETTQQQALDDAMVKFAGGECPSRSESVNGPSDAIQMTLITRTKDSKEYCQLATTEDTDIPMSKKSNSLAEPNPSSPGKHLTSALQIVKDFIKSVIRILKNPLYALLAIEISIICVPLAGIGPFFIKYIMFEYNVPMAMTNMAKGLSSAITHIIGTAIGSAISTRIHTRMGYLYLIVITALIGALVTPLIIALGCDNRPIAGLPGPFGGNFSNLHANGSCICDPDLDLLSCGSDGVTYLSPCFAGCTMSNGTVFSNCAQLESGNHSSMLWPGVCKTDCEPNFYLFNVVAAFRTFVFSINNMPRHLLALRILDPEDRATGSAFMHFAPFIVSFPAPIFFGRWIESMCLVWSSDHCSLYDRDNIRYLIGGVELLVSILTVLTYAVMVVLCRRQDRLLLERLMPSQEINIDPDRDEEEGNEEGKYNEEEVLNEELAKEESDDFQRNDR